MKDHKRLWGAGFILLCLIIVGILWAIKKEKPTVTAATMAVAVHAATVGQQPMVATVSAVGILSANADVMVSSETAGRIVALAMRVGERISKGGLLAQVDDELLLIAVDQAKAQLLTAEANLDKSRRDLQRVEKLQAADGASASDLEGARLALRAAEAQFKSAEVALKYSERQLGDSKIKAPISGYIAAKYIEVGEMVGPGRPVANMVDMEKVKMKLTIAEKDIVKVKKGQTCRITLDACPGRYFPGVVWSVAAKSETPSAHAYPVEVLMDNPPQSGIKAGMFGRVTVQVDSLPNAVVIPKEAVINSAGGGQQAFVINDLHASLRNIKTGVISDSTVQVLAGLQVGETLVTFGQSTLKDGDAVRIVENR